MCLEAISGPNFGKVDVLDHLADGGLEVMGGHFKLCPLTSDDLQFGHCQLFGRGWVSGLLFEVPSISHEVLGGFDGGQGHVHGHHDDRGGHFGVEPILPIEPFCFQFLQILSDFENFKCNG